MRSDRRLTFFQIIIFVAIGIVFSRLDRQTPIQQRQQVTTSSAVIPVIQTASIADVIHYGESLWDIFRKHDIAENDIAPAIAEFKKIFNPRGLHAGDHYQLVCDSTKQLIAYKYLPDVTTVYKVEKDSSGNFIGEVEKQPLTGRIKTLSGTIATTLYESIIEQGETPELIMNFTDIFQWDVDFFVEPQPGDSYKLIYEVFSLGDQFVRYGRILAAQYNLSGRIFNAFYFAGKTGSGGYYDWSGQSFQKTFLKSPLNYRKITSYFSMARRHPILKRVRPHFGIDFAAPAGTPVVAPANGVVVEMGFQASGVGRFIKIRHKNSHFETLYGHLQAYASGIAVGTLVEQRQMIGYVGATGLATGPHLHYTFYENGRPINPLRIQNASAEPLRAEQVPVFRQEARHWLGMLAESFSGNYAYNTREY